MKAPLTDLSIQKLAAPEGRQLDVWDAHLPSFGVRVSYGGAKTFVLKQRNRRYSLGRYPYVTLKQARQEALRRIGLKYAPKAATPVDELIQTYLAHQAKRVRPGSLSRFKRHLSQHFPFKGDLNTLTTSDVLRYINPLTPSQQNIAFTIIKAFLNWCLAGNHIDRNPLQQAKLPHKKITRDRTLTDAELSQILRAATSANPFHRLITLLAYTGQRRNQVAHLKWEYIAESTVTWPREDMKGSIQHTIPFGPRVRTILDELPRTSPFVLGIRFTDFDRPKKEFDARLPIAHWTLHDLRRTLVTRWAAIGIKQEVTERYVAHKTGKVSGIAGVYNRHEYMSEMRDAALAWEAYLARLLQPK